ncbi:MAG: hypothetical protein FWE03_03325 [Firmicutes bacterium]|nr:hypothetical protein [Bacillota bacterium]
MKASIFEDLQHLENKEAIIKTLIENDDKWFYNLCDALFPKGTKKSFIKIKTEQRKKAILENDIEWFNVFLDNLFSQPIFNKIADFLMDELYAEFFINNCPLDEILDKHILLSEIIHRQEKTEAQILQESGQYWIENYITGRQKFNENAQNQISKKLSQRTSIRKKPLIVHLSSIAAALILILGFYFSWHLFFPSFGPPVDTPYTPPNFNVLHRRYKSISLTSLNSHLGDALNISLDDDITMTISRTYDAFYAQNLFFRIRFACQNRLILDCFMTIYPNKYYSAIPLEYIFALEPKNTTIDNISVLYFRQYDFFENYNEFLFSYIARLTINDITIDIRYTQVSQTNESGFFNFISETFS